VAEDYRTIIQELEAYGGELADKPRVTVLNKVDALDVEQRAEAKAELEEACGGAVYEMSGAAKLGVTEVLRALRAEIDDNRLRQKAQDEEPESWQP
jgi:GTP-binding protein